MAKGNERAAIMWFQRYEYKVEFMDNSKLDSEGTPYKWKYTS